jgi:hypothetical protein
MAMQDDRGWPLKIYSIDDKTYSIGDWRFFTFENPWWLSMIGRVNIPTAYDISVPIGWRLVQEEGYIWLRNVFGNQMSASEVYDLAKNGDFGFKLK